MLSWVIVELSRCIELCMITGYFKIVPENISTGSNNQNNQKHARNKIIVVVSSLIVSSCVQIKNINYITDK